MWCFSIQERISSPTMSFRWFPDSFPSIRILVYNGNLRKTILLPRFLNCRSFTKKWAHLTVFRHNDVKMHAILPYGVLIAFPPSILVSLKRFNTNTWVDNPVVILLGCFKKHSCCEKRSSRWKPEGLLQTQRVGIPAILNVMRFNTGENKNKKLPVFFSVGELRTVTMPPRPPRNICFF